MQYKCPKCGKEYGDKEKSVELPRYCYDCAQIECTKLTKLSPPLDSKPSKAKPKRK